MHTIIIQRATRESPSPSFFLMRKWANVALNAGCQEASELMIRIVNLEEIIYLNESFRQKHKPTNVLSFPFDMPPHAKTEVRLLGDIVICASVVNQEAFTQGKDTQAHWAHMIIHGVLHLLGYDHEQDQEAEIMEALEIQLLAKLGFPNPYNLPGEKQ